MSAIISYFKRKRDQANDPNSVANIEKRAREKILLQAKAGQQKKQSSTETGTKKKQTSSSPSTDGAGGAATSPVVSGTSRPRSKVEQEVETLEGSNHRSQLHSESAGEVVQPAPRQSSSISSRAKVSRGNFIATETDLSTEDGEPWAGAPNAASQFQAKLAPNDPDTEAKLPPPGMGLFAHLN